MIIAHRGGAPHLGENTADAFSYGIQAGADMLEMDVQRTADGHLVVVHDAFVQLDHGYRRPVRSLPLNELRRKLSGLLTFDEFLERFGQTMPVNVDIKAEGIEPDVVQALRRYDLVDQMLVSSTSARSLRLVKFLAPEVKIGLSRGQIVPWLGREPHSRIAAELLRPTLPAQLLVHGEMALADTFMLNYRLIQPWLVRYLHRTGFSVSCWTANDPGTVRWLIDAGVDYIATDHPERIVEFLRDEGAG
jgi:glycerophosphoryl diester phosphodiesterase